MPSSQITLDRPREVAYYFRDTRELSRRLGGLSLVGMLTRLNELDPEALTLFTWRGLANKDKRITIEKTEELIQALLDAGGRQADLLNQISEALIECGVLRVSKNGGEPEPPFPRASTPD